MDRVFGFHKTELLFTKAICHKRNQTEKEDSIIWVKSTDREDGLKESLKDEESM